MKMTLPNHKPILATLVKRTVSFFLGVCLLILFLYGIGTRQGFMDTTQLALLQGAITAGLFLGVASGYGIMMNLWLTFRKQIPSLWGVGSYMVSGIFGLGTAVLAVFILVLTGGRNP